MLYTLKNGETIIAESDNPIVYVENQFGWQVDNTIWVDTERTFTLEAPVQVPNSVTPYQARSALLSAGLLDTVETVVNTAGGQVKIAWEYATTFERNSAFILSIQPMLGLSNTQVDDLFILASSIT